MVRHLSRPVALAPLVGALGCGSPETLPPSVSTGGSEGGLVSSGGLSASGSGGGNRPDLGDDGWLQCPGADRPDRDFTYIWVANSPQGTVSKIDTRSGTEVGRYYTGPSMGQDDPSRTSVNLAGDVAVSNRAGGIAKFAAHDGGCTDRNGDGVIQTSTGPTDVLPWAEEECRMWYREIELVGAELLPNVRSQGPRPTAWDQGPTLDPCADDHRVWVGWYEASAETGHFLRLDGASGDVLDEVDVPNWVAAYATGYGPYGGAIDDENDLWVLGLGGPLVRIDGSTLNHRVWELPAGIQGYGIAVDADGDPWIAGLDGTVSRFDASSGSFQIVDVGGTLRGLQIDRSGTLWAARGGLGAQGSCGVASVDVRSGTVLDAALPLPGCVEPVGVSVDIDGYVWLPDRGADGAHRLDPADLSTIFVSGLDAPYTYSDMTGAGLGLVAYPPA